MEFVVNVAVNSLVRSLLGRRAMNITEICLYLKCDYDENFACPFLFRF